MRGTTRNRIADGLDRAHLLRPAERLREEWLVRRAREGDTCGPDGVPLPPPRLRLLVAGRSADAGHFLVVGRQIDLGFVAGEAEGEPLLLLTLETAPGLGVVHGFGREVVQDPVVRPRQQFDRGDAGLLMQFAAGGRILAAVRRDAQQFEIRASLQAGADLQAGGAGLAVDKNRVGHARFSCHSR